LAPQVAGWSRVGRHAMQRGGGLENLRPSRRLERNRQATKGRTSSGDAPGHRRSNRAREPAHAGIVALAAITLDVRAEKSACKQSADAARHGAAPHTIVRYRSIEWSLRVQTDHRASPTESPDSLPWNCRTFPCRAAQPLMYDRTGCLLGRDGADWRSDDAPASRTNLHEQADANPADFKAASPDAGSIDIGRCRIGKESAALNVDIRPLSDDHAVQGVHGPNEERRERR